MWFIVLTKFRRKPTKQDTDKMNAYWPQAEKWGVKRHSAYWTLGRYDAVFIFEAPDEKTALKFQMNAPTDLGATETLVGVSRDDAVKLMG